MSNPVPSRPTALRRVPALALALLLAACGTTPRAPEAPPPRPADVRAQVERLLPAGVEDRSGWAADIQVAFSALRLAPDAGNLCAVLAVTEQESTYNADPPVPGLARIAREEIEQRASRLHVPGFAVRAALHLRSPDGRTFAERLDAARTERELSDIYNDMIDLVPLGRRLFADANPVRTGGPMQVRIAFAERLVEQHGYPYPIHGTVRDEVFTRRGGMYFGIAHLLGYPASYDRPLYRFADFNAGWYASRNAAFQQAVTLASGIPLALDGDLILHEPADNGPEVGATELAVRSLAAHLGLGERRIRNDLERGDRPGFEQTQVYERVFALAEQMEGRELPRAVMPAIALDSPKITRSLTTEWFASNVERRYRQCMARAGG